MLMKLDTPYRRVKVDPYRLPCNELNSQWTKDLSIALDTLKLLVNRVETMFQIRGTGKSFLTGPQECRPTIGKWH